MSAPSPTPALLTAIGQIAIRAGDLARAVPFYRDRLGLRLVLSHRWLPSLLVHSQCWCTVNWTTRRSFSHLLNMCKFEI